MPVAAGPTRHGRASTAAGRTVSVDLVVPVHNEAHVVGSTVGVLHAFAGEHLPYDWRITVVDNASTDGTRRVVEAVAHALDRVGLARLEWKGRGGALRHAWSTSPADVLVYMDADLSTGLEALLPLVDAIVVDGADVAIGSRLVSGAQLERRRTRDVLSRGYNRMLRTVLRTNFRDAQCGFKAVRADVARALLPLVLDDGWFFDTELLVTAQRSGLVIVELPVRRIDDSDSRVEIVPTVLADLRGVGRLLWRQPRLPAGPIGRA